MENVIHSTWCLGASENARNNDDRQMDCLGSLKTNVLGEFQLRHFSTPDENTIIYHKFKQNVGGSDQNNKLEPFKMIVNC